MFAFLKYVCIVVVLLFLGCSPKTRKMITKPDVAAQPHPLNQPAEKFTEANITLLLPFKLNQFNLKTATKAQIEKANLAIDFYQGLKMGIDSAATFGLNFKLKVLDTRDENSQLISLFKKENINNSHLIIGPVFPEGIKYASSFVLANHIPMVSPLAATKPSQFANPQLISMVNDIDQHAAKIASYIINNYQSDQTVVVLINPKKTADEQFATPIKAYFKQHHPSFVLQEFTSGYAFETKMSKDKDYAVILCSQDMAFVKPTLAKLYKLKNLKTGGFNINLFGHPGWNKQDYNIEYFQALNTIISASYQVDYKSKAVIHFIKKYRSQFNFEPSEYAFKGFDIGFYFGKLLTKYGANYTDFLTKENYAGLHNSFNFGYSPLYGYYNTHLMLLQYKDLALIKIN